MKFLYLIFFFFIFNAAHAQDVIYSPTGEKIPAKFVSILADKIKYKNPDNLTGPDYSKSFSKMLFAFNASGNYLVFDQVTPITESEKSVFVNAGPAARSIDILVDIKGGVSTLNVREEKDANISGTIKGKTIKVAKSLLVAIIRKNGTHQLFVSPDKAAPFLAGAKGKVNQLLGLADDVPAPAPTAAVKNPPAPVTPPAVKNQPVPVTTAVVKNPAAAPATQPVAPASPGITPPAATPVINTPTNTDLAVDMKLFSKKALQKTEDFGSYLNTICSVKTQRELANKSIKLACDLFINEEARVEVSSVNTGEKPKYKIRTYLNRLQLRSGQYDKVVIEYADINYASKFTKGADGNYYAVITFVQNFKGFIDGKVVYGDRTKRNVTVVLKTYEKAVDGSTQSGWDVFLENMGVVETKKS